MQANFQPPRAVAELIDAYVASRPTMKAGSARQLRYSERAFATFLQSTPTLGHLADDTINQFTAWRHQTTSTATAKRNCDHLILLWTFAAERGFVSVRPGNVAKLKLTRRKAESWTLSDVLKLLIAADRLRGRMPSRKDRPRCRRTTGVPCSQFWTSLILFLRDTGMRVSDALSVRPAQIDLDANEVILQGDKRLPLSRPTIRAICRHLDQREPVVWYCGRRKDRLPRCYINRLLASAGLPAATRSKFESLRRIGEPSKTLIADDVVRYISSGIWPNVIAEALQPCPRGKKPKTDAVAAVLRTLGPDHLETLAALLMTVGRLRSNDGRGAAMTDCLN